jgi:hypothetical protein
MGHRSNEFNVQSPTSGLASISATPERRQQKITNCFFAILKKQIFIEAGFHRFTCKGLVTQVGGAYRRAAGLESWPQSYACRL